MKKLTALFFSTLLLLSGSTGFAEVKAPEWSDFCPAQYVNAKYDSNDYSYKYNGFKELVLIFSVIGYPIAERHSHKYLASLEKVKEQNANNYWVSRQITFDKEVETYKSWTLIINPCAI